MNNKILEILSNKGAIEVIFSRHNLGEEYSFSTESEVLDLFNQLDVKGKSVTFYPITTISTVGTVGLPYYELTCGNETYRASRFIVEGDL